MMGKCHSGCSEVSERKSRMCLRMKCWQLLPSWMASMLAFIIGAEVTSGTAAVISCITSAYDLREHELQ